MNQGIQQYEDQQYEEQEVEHIPEDKDGLIAYLKNKLEQTHVIFWSFGVFKMNRER